MFFSNKYWKRRPINGKNGFPQTLRQRENLITCVSLTTWENSSTKRTSRIHLCVDYRSIFMIPSKHWWPVGHNPLISGSDLGESRKHVPGDHKIIGLPKQKFKTVNWTALVSVKTEKCNLIKSTKFVVRYQRGNVLVNAEVP